MVEEIPKLTIRKVRPDEGLALDEIFCASIRGLTGPLYTEEMQEAWIWNSSPERWTQRISEIDFWVGEIEGQVVGFVSIDQPNKVLDHLFVHPAYSGQGNGAALMIFALDYARSKGFTKLELNGSLNAIPFYKSFGWIEVAQLSKCRGDVSLPCTLLTLVL